MDVVDIDRVHEHIEDLIVEVERLQGELKAYDTGVRSGSVSCDKVYTEHYLQKAEEELLNLMRQEEMTHE